MIKVDFLEPTTPEWQDWKRRAQAKCRESIQQGGRGRIDEDLYKEMREALFSAYHRKCVYCETKFRLSEIGDVEHFRPKAGVRDRANRVVSRQIPNDPGAGKETHPGYYWLAYDPDNLLAACSLCNRVSLGFGKGEKFPVADGIHAWEPDAVQHEAPLLLNPRFDDPAQHLVFDRDTGILLAGTECGRVCIEIFGLNDRDDLLAARLDVFERVRTTFGALMPRWNEFSHRESAKILDHLSTYCDGSAAHCIAGRAALADCFAEMETFRQHLRSRLQWPQ